MNGIILVQSEKPKPSGEGKEFIVLERSDGPLFEVAKKCKDLGEPLVNRIEWDTCARCRARRNGGVHCPSCGAAEVWT